MTENNIVLEYLDHVNRELTAMFEHASMTIKTAYRAMGEVKEDGQPALNMLIHIAGKVEEDVSRLQVTWSVYEDALRTVGVGRNEEGCKDQPENGQ